MAIKQSARVGRIRKDRSGLIATAPISVAILLATLILSKAKELPSQPAIKQAPVVAAFDSVSIPVPANPVPAGAKLKNVLFRTINYPEHQVPEGALRNVSSFQEAVTLTPLPANLPIFKENISLTASARNPVIDKIPSGLRAITVRVDATAAVEGWAGSGAYVDVLLIAKEQTKVVAENVQILSAERSIEPVSTAVSPEIPRTVTLLVTQSHALAISAASNLGKLTFALRSNGDTEHWSNQSLDTEDVRGYRKNSKPAQVTGYVKVNSANSTGPAFALVDGKWIPTTVKPGGFLIGEDIRNETE